MNPNFLHRRRAERFAQLLDEAGGGRRQTRPGPDDQLAELVAIGHQARALRHAVEPDPDFRAGLRALLMATAERDGIGRTARGAAEPERAWDRLRTSATGRPSRVRARGAIIVGVALGAIAVSGMSAASENAVPGDALYGVKRSAERAQLALASSDVTRGQLYLDFAHTRVAEASAVRRDREGFAAVLEDMDSDTRQGVRLLTTSAVVRRDPAALDAIESFVTVQRLDLGALLGQVAHDNRARMLDSLSLLDSITKRADSLRATLSCGDSPSAGADRLGPRPRHCTSGAAPRIPNRDRTLPDRQTVLDAPTHRRTETAEIQTGQDAPGTQPGGIQVASAEPNRAVQADPAVPAAAPEDDGGVLTEVGQILGDLLG